MIVHNAEYDQIRDGVCDGTIVFFKAHTVFAKGITLFTGGEYSHCGIAVWMYDQEGTGRLMLVESTFGGCRVSNLSSYLKRGMCFVDVRLDWSLVRDYVLDKPGIIRYSYVDFVSIGLKDVLTRAGFVKLAEKMPNNDGEVCSEMAARALRKSGIHVPKIISPNSLRDLLLSNSRLTTAYYVEPK